MKQEIGFKNEQKQRRICTVQKQNKSTILAL